MFWDTFSELCAEVGESPNAVAAKCGVKSSGTVTGWKNGAKPRPAVLRKIAAYFHKDVSVFATKNIRNPVVANVITSAAQQAQDELAEYLELLRDRPETRALLHVGRGMTKEQIEQMANFMMTMRGGSDGEAD
jgi:transcriptional regulator with XRE-family HTH domain